MTKQYLAKAAKVVCRRGFRRGLRFSTGCAGLALLSACAANHRGGDVSGLSTNYYVAHAAGDYRPPGPPSDPWGPYINVAASRFDVPGQWIREVMQVESGGHQYLGGQLTVSGAGAMGLMQLEPDTYQEMASRYGLGSDPFNPYDNIQAGAAYIHEMYEVYGSPGFLAAYNAGPGRLDSYMNYNRPLPHETTHYVAMIAPHIQGYYPNHRSEADELALNTEPMGVSTGILPVGFVPGAPMPSEPSRQDAPVQVAMVSRAPALAEPEPVAVAYTAPVVPEPVVRPAVVAAPVVVAAADAPAPVLAQPEQGSAVYTPADTSAVYTPADTSAVYTPAAETPAASAPPAYAQPAYAQPAYVAAAFHPDAQPAYLPPPPAPPPVRHGFSLIPAAMADTPPPQMQAVVSGHEGWAVQVGAYNTASNANAALGMAELSAVQMLMHGRPRVVETRNGGVTKYRARFVGLPHEQAVDACERLSHGPTGCVVLSPAAQS